MSHTKDTVKLLHTAFPQVRTADTCLFSDPCFFDVFERVQRGAALETPGSAGRGELGEGEAPRDS